MMNDSVIEDAQILEFARRWMPYGGGNSGDLLVEFGMTPAGYRDRLRRILNGPVGRRLEPALRAQLTEYVAVHARRGRGR
jgi:uracil-DNA glycosylase